MPTRSRWWHRTRPIYALDLHGYLCKIWWFRVKRWPNCSIDYLAGSTNFMHFCGVLKCILQQTGSNYWRHKREIWCEADYLRQVFETLWSSVKPFSTNSTQSHRVRYSWKLFAITSDRLVTSCLVWLLSLLVWMFTYNLMTLYQTVLEIFEPLSLWRMNDERRRTNDGGRKSWHKAKTPFCLLKNQRFCRSCFSKNTCQLLRWEIH